MRNTIAGRWLVFRAHSVLRRIGHHFHAGLTTIRPGQYIISRTCIKVAVITKGVIHYTKTPGLLEWNMTSLAGNIFNMLCCVLTEFCFMGNIWICTFIKIGEMATLTSFGTRVVVQVVSDHMRGISSLEEVMHGLKIFAGSVVRLGEMAGATTHF